MYERMTTDQSFLEEGCKLKESQTQPNELTPPIKQFSSEDASNNYNTELCDPFLSSSLNLQRQATLLIEDDLPPQPPPPPQQQQQQHEAVSDRPKPPRKMTLSSRRPSLKISIPSENYHYLEAKIPPPPVLPLFAQPATTLSSSQSFTVDERASSLFSPSTRMVRSQSLLVPISSSARYVPDMSSHGAHPVLILPYLYLGNDEHASNAMVLRRLNIMYVVNCAVECENHFEHHGDMAITYHNLRLEHDSDHIQELFAALFTLIDRAREAKRAVLVHCLFGQSRSAAVMVAYLMGSMRWTFVKAYHLVKTACPYVNLHPTLHMQLLEFEKHLFVHKPDGSN
jgi:protein-tyrosine phosphatase